MHTFEVTFTDGSTETFCAERIQYAPTHIVFDNTENSLGYGNFSLEAAILASRVESIVELGGTTGARRIKAKAWDEGADFGLAARGYSRQNTNIDGENPYKESK